MAGRGKSFPGCFQGSVVTTRNLLDAVVRLKTLKRFVNVSSFGKALGNGFAISALAGKRDIMELGGLDHKKETGLARDRGEEALDFLV